MFQEKKIIISINMARNSCKKKNPENCPMNLAPLEVTSVLLGKSSLDSKLETKGR